MCSPANFLSIALDRGVYFYKADQYNNKLCHIVDKFLCKKFFGWLDF